jgi:DNA replication protein DnaC
MIRRHRAARRERDPAAKRAELELLAKLGRRYHGATLDGYEIDGQLDADAQDRQRATVTKIREYLDELPAQIDGGRNLILYGTVGTGKDHLLAVACKAAAAIDRRVEWRNAADIFTAAKATWGKAGASVEDILQPLQRADVLALSDPIPAVGEIDHHEVRWLLALIDKRYREMRPTWVTLNAADGNDARKALSHQVVDRLQHNATVCDMKWNSYRVRRAEGGVK